MKKNRFSFHFPYPAAQYDFDETIIAYTERRKKIEKCRSMVHKNVCFILPNNLW